MIEPGKYCLRFGKVAVENGYLDAERLQLAISEQVKDNLADRPHRVLGAICFDHGWMTAAQIDNVLNLMFKNSHTNQETVAQ